MLPNVETIVLGYSHLKDEWLHFSHPTPPPPGDIDPRMLALIHTNSIPHNTILY